VDGEFKNKFTRVGKLRKFKPTFLSSYILEKFTLKTKTWKFLVKAIIAALLLIFLYSFIMHDSSNNLSASNSVGEPCYLPRDVAVLVYYATTGQLF